MANKTIIHTDFNDNVNNNESQHVGIFGEAAKNTLILVHMIYLWKHQKCKGKEKC